MPINITLALLRRDHAVMEITLCQMSPYGTLCSLKRIFVEVFVCRCYYLYSC